VRALVTGGAGFIGSHLVDALVERDDQVAVIDDLSVGKASNLERHLDDGRIRLVQASILEPEALEPLVAGSDLVFHLAAVVGVRYVVDDPLKAIATNVRGTERVLESAFRHKVRAVIASSSEVYGKSTDLPLREDADRVLGPTTAKRWCYSDAKAIDEYLAWAYVGKGLSVSAVRYFNVYGPRLDPLGYGSVMAQFIMQAMRGEPITVYDDGNQTRCFTYVSDAVEGTIRAGTRDAAVGKAFNIGTTRETTINELATLVREVTGSESAIEHVEAREVYGPGFEEARRRVPDVSRAREVLGLEAEISLEAGLERTVEWFRRSGLLDWDTEALGASRQEGGR
jgi:UDP-glucose 4-epimerase